MPRKNISDMLHRSVAGAVLFSICHFAAAETEKFDFWGLTSPTYLGDPSDDKFWESLLDGTPFSQLTMKTFSVMPTGTMLNMLQRF